MSYSIQATIRGLVAPKHQISCSSWLWRQGMTELRQRGRDRHESGAFLLGDRHDGKRRIAKFVYYDDLDPYCLERGIVVLDGSAFGKLWKICRAVHMEVVADVHTHPGSPFQSATDRDNPMMGVPGHIAIIVPNLARRSVRTHELGVYEYLGDHKWQAFLRKDAAKFFYIGMWS
jgi:proteasome lid subunit RPN8/RPN11